MHLAISNIAWNPTEDDPVAEVLRRHGVTGVEIAPTKRWDKPLEAPPREVADYRRDWADRGLEIVAMQSLLFGRPDLQLFGDATSRVSLGEYLRGIIDLGAALGAKALVFGSPKNRLRGTMSDADTAAIAVDFFHMVGEHALSRDLALCLEPVPPRYGADFLTTPAEALELCRRIDHPGIRLNADLGAMTLSGEDPRTFIEGAAPFIAHYHASEPDFVELGSDDEHERAAQGLASVGFLGWVSIEISARGENIAAVERSVCRATAAYRNADAGEVADSSGGG